MELGNEVYADCTEGYERKKTIDTGLKHWVVFAVKMMCWPVTLLDCSQWQSPEEPVSDILVAEKKLLLSARWPARDYVSSTVIKYVGQVTRAQRFMLGDASGIVGGVLSQATDSF